MRLVERHIIKSSHKYYKEIDNLCFLAKNLFNAANYTVRQSFIKENKYLNYAANYHLVKSSIDYKALPAKVSCQIIRLVDRNWASYFVAIKEFKLNPSKFTGVPSVPKYKDKVKGRCVVLYPKQAISKRALKKGLLQPSGTNIFISTAITKEVEEIRLVPRNGFYVVEAVYTVPDTKLVDFKGIAAIDLGLTNLGTVTTNIKRLTPLIVNGNPLKSINQFYNKQKAVLQSELQKQNSKRFISNRLNKLTAIRNNKVDTYLHQASRTIIKYLLQNQIGTLVIGNNTQWKTNINIGKKNNQNFVQIPHYKFIKQLTYKAQLLGITVIITEESYTSKASFLDQDLIPKYKEGQKHSFSGLRVKRGLYKSANGTLINADVNGSLNILRKAIPNVFAEGIEGLGVIPFRLTPGKVTL